MPPWTLVTPASRGIGLEFARRLLRTTDLPVVATARGSTDQARESILQKRSESQFPEADTEGDESRLHVLKLDVTNEDTIADAAAQCASLFPSKPQDGSPASHLHLALALPGILRAEKSPAQLNLPDIRDTFDINLIGPLLLMKHFAPFLPRKNAQALPLEEAAAGPLPTKHATWAVMSARVGSISDNAAGGWYSYRASKAGVTQMVKSLDNFLKAQNGASACALAMHPGTVKTNLSKDYWQSTANDKLFTPEYAAERLLTMIGKVGVDGRGRLWDYKQEEIPP